MSCTRPPIRHASSSSCAPWSPKCARSIRTPRSYQARWARTTWIPGRPGPQWRAGCTASCRSTRTRSDAQASRRATLRRSARKDRGPSRPPPPDLSARLRVFLQVTQVKDQSGAWTYLIRCVGQWRAGVAKNVWTGGGAFGTECHTMTCRTTHRSLLSGDYSG